MTTPSPPAALDSRDIRILSLEDRVKDLYQDVIYWQQVADGLILIIEAASADPSEVQDLNDRIREKFGRLLA